MKADDFDVRVCVDGSTSVTYHTPPLSPLEDLPAPPRVVTSFELGTVHADGATTFLAIIETHMGPLVLLFPLAPMQMLADGIAETVAQFS